MITLTTLLALLPFTSPVASQGVPTEAPPSDALEIVVYDIRDLSRTKGSNIDLLSIPDRPQTPGSGDKVDEELKLRRAEDYAALCDVVARHCQPSLEPKQSQLQVMDHGVMVAQVNAAQNEWIESFLQRQRKEDLTLYTCEARIATLPSEELAGLGLGKSPAILDEKGADALLEKLQSREDTEIDTRPAGSALGRQKLTLSVTEQVAYVSRYEQYENVAPDGRTVVDPIIEVLQTGLTATFRATGVDDELIDLDLHVEHVVILEMKAVESELGEVLAPMLATRSMRSSLALERGSTAVFSGLGTDDETTIFLVRVKTAEPPK